MKRAASLFALLVVSMAAGVWLYRNAGREDANDSCNAAGTCSVEVAEPAPAEQPPAAPVSEAAPTPAPPPEPAPAAPAPAAPPMDAAKLREESDRLLSEGRVREAVAALRKATQIDPSARNHGDLGKLLGKLTSFDEALIHLRAAAELEPNNADRWIDLANGYYRKVDPGEAWKAERRAKEAEPGLVLGRDASGMRVRRSDSPAPKP